MIAVSVTFSIRPGAMDRFMAAMHAQADNSLSREPDCLRFDICTAGEDAHEVYLYELYTDRAAFDAHLATDHFKSFDAEVAPYLAEKIVKIYGDVREATG